VSRSPKYSAVSASELTRRRLEQERRERERKRAQEQAKRAKIAVDKAKAAASSRLDSLAARCGALGRQPSANAADLAPVNEALKRARRTVDSAANFDEIAAAVRALDEAERLRVDTSAEVLRRSTRNAATQLASLRGLLAELNAGQRARFDPVAAASIDDAVATLARALDRGNIASFETSVEGVLASVRAHHITVSEQVAEHGERINAATVAADELAARIAGLTADARAARTPLGDLPVAADVLDSVRAELEADRPVEALELAVRLSARLDDLEGDLDTAIERLSARREMLGSIIEALPALGFAVDVASLVHGDDGSIGVQAQRLGGEALTVVVQDDEAEEHRVNYLRDAAGTRVLDGKACSSLRTLAEDLNSSLRRNGYDPGAVTWDDDAKRPPPGGGRVSMAEEQAVRYRSEPR
jgi:hypothetical protein